MAYLYRHHKKELIGLIFVGLLFVVAAYAAHVFQPFLQGFVSHSGVLGMVLYTGISALLVILAPISSLPLLPVAVSMWGSFAAALMSLTGWIVGAVIAFFLARRYGMPLVLRFVSRSTVDIIEHIVVGTASFWHILMLRAVLPFDVTSYAFGLFTKVSFKTYFWTTVIGVLPFAFILSYAITLPIGYQIAMGVIVIAVAVFFIERIVRMLPVLLPVEPELTPKPIENMG